LSRDSCKRSTSGKLPYAGYRHETAKRFACEIFKRPHVRAAIEHLLRIRTGVTKAWLIDKLVAIVDTDLADVADWDESGGLVFKAPCDLTAEQKVAVSEILEERTKLGKTLKVRLYDKLSAMSHLAKLLNLLIDRQEISGPNGGPVEVTDDRTRIIDRLDAIAKPQAPDSDGVSGILRAAALRGFTGSCQGPRQLGTRTSPCSAFDRSPVDRRGCGGR
jgi:phage terminase small subunit